MNRFCVMMIALGLSIAGFALAFARPPTNFDPALHGWFESLRQPGTGIGCCAESDCKILAPSQWRMTGSGYQIRVDEMWIDVPPDKIREHEENPTGSVVACYRQGFGPPDPSRVFIFCFVRATEA